MPLIIALGGQRLTDLSGFKASLVYRAISKIGMTTQRNSVSGKKGKRGRSLNMSRKDVWKGLDRKGREKCCN